MIPEIENMRGELNSLLAEKENEFLDYCPMRIKNAISNVRYAIITFSEESEKKPIDITVRELVLTDCGRQFDQIKSSIERIRIKTN